MKQSTAIKTITAICMILQLCYCGLAFNTGEPTINATVYTNSKDTVIVEINCPEAFVYAINYVYTRAHEDTFGTYNSVSLDGFKQLNDEVGVLLCTYNSGVCTWQDVITLKNGAYFESERIMESCDAEQSRDSYDQNILLSNIQ